MKDHYSKISIFTKKNPGKEVEFTDFSMTFPG